MKDLSQSPTDPAFVQNPYPFYEKARAHGHLFFWSDYGMVCATGAAAVGAILLGWQALRLIAKYPDVYTGAGLARAGIGLGIVCGLGSATIVGTQSFILNNEAKKFSRHFAQELKTKDFPTLMWYRVSPAARQGKTGEEVTREAQASAREGGIYETEFGPMKVCSDKIREGEMDVELVSIEQSGLDGLTPYAYAILEVHSHKTPSEQPFRSNTARRKSFTRGLYFVRLKC